MVDMNAKRIPSETAILACCDAVDRAINDIVEWHKPDYNISSADIEDFRANLYSLIRNGGAPASYFEAIAHGSFKECYEGLGNWVIKFAANFNATGAERQLLDAARDAHLSWLFPYTIFIDLPRDLQCTMLDEGENCNLDEDQTSENGCHGDCYDCQWNCPENAEVLNNIQLQPRGFASNDIAYTAFNYSEHSYANNPVRYKNNAVVPYNIVYALGASDQDWVQALIDNYGDENFHRFCRFVEKFKLEDLHAGNTGYITTSLGDMPIVLDWLSSFGDD